jgi:protein gp37
MGQTTIEWTATYNDDGTVSPGYTFNPWQGCIKVSPGCVNCYAETLSNRWGKDVWGPGPKRQRTSAANWKKPLQWNKQAEKEGRRFRVFCASMADVFEDNPQLEPWRVDLLNLIQETPRLDWLLLTKRPENVNRMIEQATGFSSSEMWFYSAPHVQIGTSIENQEYADKRIPELLRIPARIRFLSMEPLLGPVDLTRIDYGSIDPTGRADVLREWYYRDSRLVEKAPPGEACKIHWVIVGGESGPGARPMHPEWVRSLRDQCQGAGVAFFFKQWGQYLPVFNSYTTPDGYDFVKVGKAAAGRLLDGQEWSQFPVAAAEKGA